MDTNVKKAAIKLKSIGSSDRKWLLKQLSAQEKAKVMPALQSLDKISFQQVFDLDQLLGKEEVATTDKTAISQNNNQSNKTIRSRFDEYSETEIDRVLNQVSDVFLSFLMNQGDQLRLHPLLKNIDADRRQRISAMCQPTQIPLGSKAELPIEDFIAAKLEKVKHG